MSESGKSSPGLLDRLRLNAIRADERLREYRLGIETRGWIRPSQLTSPEEHEYAPVYFHAADALFDQVPPHPRTVFVDYGSGKGRILVMAAARPYHRVIGVEISPTLCADAEDNLRRARIRRRCHRVDVICADATDFIVPPDANVFYFGNPFGGDVLRNVVGNLRNSFGENPRTMTFLVYNHANFIAETSSEGWLRRTFFKLGFPSFSISAYTTDDIDSHR